MFLSSSPGILPEEAKSDGHKQDGRILLKYKDREHNIGGGLGRSSSSSSSSSVSRPSSGGETIQQ